MQNPFEGNNHAQGAQAFMLICAILQLLLMVQSIRYFLKRSLLYVIPLKLVLQIYLSTILGFTSIYAACEAFLPKNSFDIFPYDGFASYGKRMFSFLYFSASTMSSSGIGDISPKEWHSTAIAMVEMILGVVYHIVIFSISLVHLNIDRSFLQDSACQVTENNSNINSGSRLKLCFKRVMDSFSNYHVVITIFMSLISELILRLDTNGGSRKFAFAFTLNAINLLLLLILSIRIAKLYNNQSIRLSDIVKDYISLLFVFASIYTTIFDLYGSDGFVIPKRGNDYIFRSWW
jgi:hypothetical protein